MSVYDPVNVLIGSEVQPVGYVCPHCGGMVGNLPEEVARHESWHRASDRTVAGLRRMLRRLFEALL